MRVRRRVFPPFIAKRVEGIFGYDILLYGFLFRRQWGSLSWSFARIVLLFIKWHRVEHKAARADFLGSARALDSMRCGVQALIYTRKTRKNIYLCFALISIYLSNRFDYVIIQRSTKLFLNYRYYNPYREIQTKFYYQKKRLRITLIRRKWLFRSIISENYCKILDNVSTPQVFNKI